MGVVNDNWNEQRSQRLRRLGGCGRARASARSSRERFGGREMLLLFRMFTTNTHTSVYIVITLTLINDNPYHTYGFISGMRSPVAGRAGQGAEGLHT